MISSSGCIAGGIRGFCRRRKAKCGDENAQRGMTSTHAPSAGTNRIRFNGFAGVRYAASISGP